MCDISKSCPWGTIYTCLKCLNLKYLIENFITRLYKTRGFFSKSLPKFFKNVFQSPNPVNTITVFKIQHKLHKDFETKKSV